MSKDFILKTSRNHVLRVTAFGKNNIEHKPCVICVHGFKGFKDWGFWPFTAKYLSDNGFFVITFNFSHNGIGEKLTEFTELDKFAENTFTLEIEELTEIISAYRNNFFGTVAENKIGILGHSRGGGVSLLTAAKRNDVNALAVWASIARTDRYTERQKMDWREKRVIEVLNSRTNQLMKLNISLLEDIEQNKENSLNILKAAKDFKGELFIAHGEQDLTVPVDEADQLFDHADKTRTVLYKIPATGHTFDIVHPFRGTNSKFRTLLEKTTQFFKTYLFLRSYVS